MPGVTEGGGASRSTEPARGTSTATDVSLREYFIARLDALDRIVAAQREADRLAVDKAFEASQELAAKHNDLIRQMERKDATYVSKDEIDSRRDEVDRRISRIERFQAMLTGGMILVSFVGIANLVKLWGG